MSCCQRSNLSTLLDDIATAVLPRGHARCVLNLSLLQYPAILCTAITDQEVMLALTEPLLLYNIFGFLAATAYSSSFSARHSRPRANQGIDQTAQSSWLHIRNSSDSAAVQNLSILTASNSTADPHTALASQDLSDVDVNCNGELYGRNLNLVSCYDVVHSISTSTRPTLFGQRSRGPATAVNLPLRFISSTSPSSLNESMHLDVAKSLTDMCHTFR